MMSLLEDFVFFANHQEDGQSTYAIATDQVNDNIAFARVE